MIDKNDKIALRQIMLDHYLEPDNKGIKENLGYIKYQDSPVCSDEINVQIIMMDNKIKKASFEGTTCAISGAAIDILCGQINGKTKEQALQLLSNYHNMITGHEYNEEDLEELIIFNEIYKQGNRINCALLGAEGIRYILKNEVK